MFYVYEHWRPDKNECFYVGKGTRKRAMDLCCRNKLHRATRTHLKNKGMDFEVRFIFETENEPEVYEFEEFIIGERRLSGNPLRANFRLGGRDNSGWKHTPEAIEKIRQANLKRIYPKGKDHPNYGKKEKFGFNLTRDIAEENRKRVWTAEARLKASLLRLGKKTGRTGGGWKVDEEGRRNMSEGQKRRHAVTRLKNGSRNLVLFEEL